MKAEDDFSDEELDDEEQKRLASARSYVLLLLYDMAATVALTSRGEKQGSL